MNYAAAFIEFLDRESGELKKAYLYPITKIQLVTQDAKDQIKMVVNDKGEWEEANGSK